MTRDTARALRLAIAGGADKASLEKAGNSERVQQAMLIRLGYLELGGSPTGQIRALAKANMNAPRLGRRQKTS